MRLDVLSCMLPREGYCKIRRGWCRGHCSCGAPATIPFYSFRLTSYCPTNAEFLCLEGRVVIPFAYSPNVVEENHNKQICHNPPPPPAPFCNPLKVQKSHPDTSGGEPEEGPSFCSLERICQSFWPTFWAIVWEAQRMTKGEMGEKNTILSPAILNLKRSSRQTWPMGGEGAPKWG